MTTLLKARFIICATICTVIVLALTVSAATSAPFNAKIGYLASGPMPDCKDCDLVASGPMPDCKDCDLVASGPMPDCKDCDLVA